MATPESDAGPAGAAGPGAGARAGTGNPFLDFTDAHLRAAMLRALRLVAILSVVGAAVLWVTVGWATAMLLLAGAAVSASGLWEWQKLIAVINGRLDGAQAGPGAGPGSSPGSARVVLGFFLRLIVAGAVLYGSLRCFHGSVYALVGGLGLAAFALAVEAVRLVRS